MTFFKKYDVWIYDIDAIFRETNKEIIKYLDSAGLPITFDFSKKDNQKLYIHFFLTVIVNFIITDPNNCKMIFYSCDMTKDAFRRNLIEKIKKIFGFKIWSGAWSHLEFLKVLKGQYAQLDEFELYVQSETKPKTFKHIKKYLEKEGFTSLNDSFFKDLANKRMVCG